MNCNICPRNCNVNRKEKKGFCHAQSFKIAKVMKHYWEEPCISGTNGSGTIFFCYCSLRCIYCQNYEISHLGQGKEISVDTLVSLFKQLETSGVHNINLVTPTHYTNEIIQALKIYKPKIPIVWNTSGYETQQTIKKLKKYVDIYLTDFKYFDDNIAKEYFFAPNYKQACTSAILQMRKNQPEDIFENGIMQKGIIIRHLILPTYSEDSKKILKWIKENLGIKTYISLMSQYLPCYKAKEYKAINRKIKPIEYKAVVNEFLKLGFENGFGQDFSSANCNYIPEFESKEKDEFDW